MAALEKLASGYCEPIPVNHLYNRNELHTGDCSPDLLENKRFLPSGEVILWGLPFTLGRDGQLLLLDGNAAAFSFDEPVHYPYIVFLHSADTQKLEPEEDGLVARHRGNPCLGELVAEYVLRYADGTSHALPVKRRFQINEVVTDWGEEAFGCVPHSKPSVFLTSTEEYYRGLAPTNDWGNSQFRTAAAGRDTRIRCWLYPAKNPHPEKDLCGIDFVSKSGTVLFFGMTGCHLEENPLRWESAKRVKLTLPEGMKLNRHGGYDGLDMDLGKVINTFPVRQYGDKQGHSQEPVISENSLIVEYTAHAKADLYIEPGIRVPVSALAGDEPARREGFTLAKVQMPSRLVTLRFVDKKTKRPLSVKLHAHGEDGEYLAPVNRHRIPNPYWFEDYSVDFARGWHYATYMDKEADIRLPLGRVSFEITKGYEITPVRLCHTITEETKEIVFELEHVLPWREKGWVTADTHVHFLSPQSALLEGSAEGINIVNLLASQWGELFTNVGDFDGATTIGSVENGGTGEYLVRVGTENRQHILGHISLVGYDGKMIQPLTTGGPDESRMGDAVETTLSQWAEMARKQNGLAILPHFPEPRAESAVAIVMDLIDGIEMTSWSGYHHGIQPYTLADWYRYLNCGYNVAAVGGTDKMSADTPVGAIRTYALIENEPFTYESWKEAVRRGNTFVTVGPLLTFSVNRHRPGTSFAMEARGGLMDVEWSAASVTIPVTRVELVLNGKVLETKTMDGSQTDYYGSFSFPVKESGWLALRVRGKYPGQAEIIAAHSSAIMFRVGDQPVFSPYDASTILEQIEGVTAYVTSLATKAEERLYNEVLSRLTAAHRRLHNYMHQNGMFHNHTVVDDHHGGLWVPLKG